MTAVTPVRTVHFVTSHIECPGTRDWCERRVVELGRSGGQVRLSADPNDADAVVFFGPGIRQTGWPGQNPLLGHPLVRARPHDCFIWDDQDRPLSYLPGLYASMPRGWFDRRIHRAFRYFALPTEDEPMPDVPRTIPYNFVGGPTAAVRVRLLAAPHPADAVVRGTANRNHSNPVTPDDRRRFVELLRRSRFTICPRGIGTSTYRLFEALRCGSVPVIVSDGLVLPDGPNWAACSIRVAERFVGDLPRLLGGYGGDVAAMSQRASAAYHEFFAAGVLLDQVGALVGSLRPACLRVARRAYWTGLAAETVSRAAGRLRQGLGGSKTE